MFSSFSPLLRSLTMTPASVAIDQAHKMAQRRLADGGAASARTATHEKTEPSDLVLPADVDLLAVAKAVRAKLGMPDGEDALHPLERRKLGGRVVLRSRHLIGLGDGRFDLGRAFMHQVIADIRGRRRQRRA